MRHAFRDISIRKKLFLIVVGGFYLLSCFAGAALLLYEWVSAKNRLQGEVKTLVEILSPNCIAFLEFDAPIEAEELLSAVRLKPDVDAVCIYRPDGALFAGYFRGDEIRNLPHQLLPDSLRFHRDHLALHAPLYSHTTLVGSLYLRANYRILVAKVRTAAALVGGGIAVMTLATILILRYLANNITQPILNLSRLAESVSASKNYSLRIPSVRPNTADEIGQLELWFNTMLAEIEKQQALLVDKEYVTSIVDNMLDMVIVTDNTGAITRVNPATLTALGYAADALTGKKAETIIAPNASTNGEDDIRRLLESTTVAHAELTYRHAGGNRIPVSFSMNLMRERGSITGKVLVARDISERQRAEAARREAEERTRLIVDNALDAAISIDANDRIIAWNIRAAEIFGWPAAEAMGKTLTETIIPPRYKEAHERGMKLYLSAGQSTILNRRMEFVACHRDGHEIPVEISVTPLRIHGSHIFSAFVRDISERKRAEKELLEEKERLAVTLRSISDGVITTNMAGEVLLMNRVAEKLTGWSQSEAAGKPLGQIFPIIEYGSKQPAPDLVRQVVQTGSTTKIDNQKLLVNHRDGAEVRISVCAAPIRDRDNSTLGVVAVFQDITEQCQVEMELQKRHKMESIGVLAGGIAHDFNNLLTGIMCNVSLARMQLGDNDSTAALLTAADLASQRAQELTQQLLTFAKGGAPIKKSVSISEIITETVSFAMRGSKTKCEFRFAEDLAPADVDAGQISQVIQNLIMNSDQAMPAGGAITIEVQNSWMEEDNPLSLQHGNYVKISIADEGTGIKPEHLPKIFDPFFTTKVKGSGLGLASVYSIVSQHGGHITAYSNFGFGTTMCVYLPASTKPVDEKRRLAPLPVGNGKILVMDDESIILDIAYNLLTALGYNVALAKDGSRAVELYQEAMVAGSPFSAVVLDLTVPGGMGGHEACTKLLALDPNVKAIVSSGYSNDPIMANFVKYGFISCIAKPYDVQRFGKAIHNVLNP